MGSRPFVVFDFRALWLSGLSAKVPESQKLNNGRLASLASNPVITVPILELWGQNGLRKEHCSLEFKYRCSLVFVNCT